MLPRYLLIARINRRLLGAERIVTNRASKSTRTPESVSRSIRVVFARLPEQRYRSEFEYWNCTKEGCDGVQVTNIDALCNK